MSRGFWAKIAVFGFVVSLLCSGCGSGVTVMAMMSPTISQVSPQVVAAGTADVTLTIQGTNFQSQATLMVNGTAVPTTVVNSTTLAAKVSGTALAQSAVAQLQVKNSDGTASNQMPLTVSGAQQGGGSLGTATTQLPGGQVGSAYSATLNAPGGKAPYSWVVSSGSLPAGLTISSGGVLAGTPTANGSFTFAITASDSSSAKQSKTTTYSLTVSAAAATPATLSIGSKTLAVAQAGASYSATLSAAGGTPGYTWSLSSGSLPAGLSLSSGGVISGTPTATGTFTFTVAVKDSGSPAQTVSAQESIAVSPAALSITTANLAAATNGSSYSTTLSATGGTPAYMWSLSSGSLPAGLSLSSGGVISGIPTATGTFTFTVAIKDNGSPAQTASAKQSITVNAAASTLTVMSTSLGAAETGSSYSTTLAASGGTPSYTWAVTSGSPPAGLTLSSAGVISGTPSNAGTSTFTVTVTDNGSPAQTASVQESISVTAPQLVIQTTSLGSGMTATGYSATLTPNGGTPGYTWSLASGSNLPAGLSLSDAGVISGTPTAAGTFTFTVSVSDSGSPVQTATAQESITIDKAITATNPAAGIAQVYVFPQTPVAPMGSYQTVTAIVNGVSDKTVTWSSDGGSIVGTNPCVVNEPCTVALYSKSTGTYHLIATSNADGQTVATSTITFTASPKPATGHPRFFLNANQLGSMQAKGNANDPMYQAMKSLANNYYGPDSSIWTYSTWNGSACTGGSAPPSDESANYRENDAWWMTTVATFDSDSATRNKYGCAARDVFMTNIRYMLSGKIDLSSGNRWSDTGYEWVLTVDYLMGGGFLSASDMTTVRQFLAKYEYELINNHYNGDQANIGNYNDPSQFDVSDQYSATGMRAMGNNYTQIRIFVMAAAALVLDDNTTDDPPLSNTCNATRYQVCPDGTAGSVHAYWTYVTGGMLYKYWADMEDPNVVQQAYNAAYGNMPSIPQCAALWTAAIGGTVPCLGAGRGGESNEGTLYGSSIGPLRQGMNLIHTAGYDDPILYGPQMSMVNMSYWDLHYLADLTNMTGLSGISSEPSRWNFFTDGDTLAYYTNPSNYGVDAAMITADSNVGRTDRSSGLQWLVMNSAFGMADGTAGGCSTGSCGLLSELGNTYAAGVDLDLFLSLPAADPTTNNPPADPRPSLPTDWYDAGNQHIVTRTGGWTTGANTIFSYYCPNTQIDHEHEFCGGFDLYSNGEYITKGRTEFNDYNDEMATTSNENTLSLIQYPGQIICTSNPWCQYWQAATEGGQFWHGYQAGLNTLFHAEMPSYVAALVDDHNAYNGGWGGYSNFNGVTAASRSLIYLRNSNQVIYYDRGTTGSNAWDKATYLVSTGKPTFNGNTASWLTRSGKQKVFWTTLSPSGTAPQLETTYTDQDAQNDWEIFGRLKADAGNTASARILSVLQWGASSSSGSSATRVVSSAGMNFEGALVGGSLVMFMHDWPGALTTVTYPASGATTQYVSDLTPNTTYSISAAGAPTSAITDSAGVLTFNAKGTGNVTITAAQ